MSDAPERIWAGNYHGTWWQSKPHHQMTEYIRADLHEAEVARLTAEVERLREAVKDAEGVLCLVENPAIPDPIFHSHVKALGIQIGFGALMSSAEAAWRETLEFNGLSGGEHVSGPSRNTVENCLARLRAALGKE